MENADSTQQTTVTKATKSRSNTKSTHLDRLIEEKQALQTQLVQVQSMLYLVDFYISEELLKDTDMQGGAN